jgi:hypothetical protein
MRKFLLAAAVAVGLAFVPSVAHASWLSQALHRLTGDYGYGPAYGGYPAPAYALPPVNAGYVPSPVDAGYYPPAPAIYDYYSPGVYGAVSPYYGGYYNPGLYGSWGYAPYRYTPWYRGGWGGYRGYYGHHGYWHHGHWGHHHR